MRDVTGSAMIFGHALASVDSKRQHARWSKHRDVLRSALIIVPSW
jgi:hypothetical protein